MPAAKASSSTTKKTKKPKRYWSLDDTKSATFRKPAIRRIARRGGIKRISGTYYEALAVITQKRLESVLHDAVTYAEYAKRKTVTVEDVLRSLKRRGMVLYGYGPVTRGTTA